jgi:predicted Rdx family selenoprotein
VGLQVFGEDCSTGARFSIVQDERVLWESDRMGSYSEARDIGDVPVERGEVLLITDEEGDAACDTTSWLDLRVVP